MPALLWAAAVGACIGLGATAYEVRRARHHLQVIQQKSGSTPKLKVSVHLDGQRIGAAVIGARPGRGLVSWPMLEPDPDPVDARVIRVRGAAPVYGRDEVVLRSIFIGADPHPIASSDDGRSWYWWGFTPLCLCGCDLAFAAIDGLGYELGVTCPSCRLRHRVEGAA